MLNLLNLLTLENPVNLVIFLKQIKHETNPILDRVQDRQTETLENLLE
jgi:hypothetical protein